jgi:hypothetical protein
MQATSVTGAVANGFKLLLDMLSVYEALSYSCMKPYAHLTGAFADGSKLLLDMYSVRAPFTEALLIDPREYSGASSKFSKLEVKVVVKLPSPGPSS